MSNPEIKSRYFILHIEVQHGSDRYDIHLHLERSPLVKDLMEELEKKSRVTTMNQQLIFRGQRIHQNPNDELAKFGIFNGNRIILIGNKLSGKQDEHFLRLLEIEKNVKLIDDVLELVCRDLENIKRSQQPRYKCEPYLYGLQTRSARCQQDLTRFLETATQLNIASNEIEPLRKRQNLTALIQDRIDIASNISAAIGSYQGNLN